MELNVVDIILIFVVALAVWSGWRKGFIHGLIDLLILAGSLAAAFHFYPYLSNFIEAQFSLGVWSAPLSFILILILTRILLNILANEILKRLAPSTYQHHANKFLGLFPGFVNGLINAVVLAALFLALPLNEAFSNKVRESRFAGVLMAPAEWLEDLFSPVFDEAVRRSMNKLTVEPESDKTVSLPFKVDDPEVREDLEGKMLELLNKERVSRGLKPLEADPEMRTVARKHSKDMFARGYFSHNTPENKTPFDRMKAEKVRFLTAGENLALAQTLSIAHTGLMNSPGHRANILQPSFGRVGIGILDGGIYGLMITQNFRN